MKIIATSRSLHGTGASRRMRNSGVTPAVVYGAADAATSIEIEHNSLFHALRKEGVRYSVLDLEIDGTVEQVLVRDVQVHPFKPMILHVDFQRVKADEPITFKVPLKFVGGETSPAVKVGGQRIKAAVFNVKITCLPKDLPNAVEVDVSKLEPSQAFKASQLALPAGVTLVLGKQKDITLAAAGK